MDTKLTCVCRPRPEARVSQCRVFPACLLVLRNKDASPSFTLPMGGKRAFAKAGRFHLLGISLCE
jgi:hypothetical protein